MGGILDSLSSFSFIILSSSPFSFPSDLDFLFTSPYSLEYQIPIP